MNYTSEQIYKYTKYLTTHIARVREAMRRFVNSEFFKGLENSDILKDGISIDSGTDLLSRVELHDNSKWRYDEFWAYLNHFYSNKDESPLDPEFDLACERHYSRNPHHVDYWRLEGRTPDEMTFGAICEMLADWVSMSVYNGSAPSNWYDTHKDVLDGMSENKRKTVEYLLVNGFEPIYYQLMEELSKEKK